MCPLVLINAVFGEVVSLRTTQCVGREWWRCTPLDMAPLLPQPLLLYADASLASICAEALMRRRAADRRGRVAYRKRHAERRLSMPLPTR